MLARRADKAKRTGRPTRRGTGEPSGSDGVLARRAHRDGEALVPVVGVGASAGGVDAFSELLRCLPGDTGMAFVLVQHLDPERESLLPEVLARATGMPVAQAKHGMRLEADRVYVIPPNAELSLSGPTLRLAPRRAASGRPAMPIDSFFRSLAEDRERRAIAVVLSGTASDGTDGLRAIQEHDGIALVQEPRSARFAGMPQSAIAAGVADRVLAVPELARELVRLSRHPYVAPREAEAHGKDAGEALRDEIRVLVRNAVGVDFNDYKPASFERRLARRMALRELTQLEDYAALLRASRPEVEALYEDLLVRVTSFFRDPQAFDALKAKVFPRILDHKPDGAPIRVWVPGCATGEEAYSIAMALLEFAEETRRTTPIQVFATDVSERTIDKARAGVYAESALRDVSEERRRRYFARVENGYRVAKTLRDLCVFVRHDLARDPPFSKLDLVSCRNVLIYFGTALQKKVLATFHYALNEPGFLLLGRSENLAAFARLFSTVDRVNKVYARTAVPSRLHVGAMPSLQLSSWPAAQAPADGARLPRDVVSRADRVLLARYGPPGALVDEKMNVLQFRGRTGPYLEQAPGQPQHNLLKMARVGLLPALRASLAEARKAGSTVRKEGVRFDDDGAMRTCSVVVIPLLEPDAKERLFLVLFEPAVSTGAPLPATRRARPARAEERLRAREVEEELAAARDSLRAAMEEHGRARDELTSANEELVSANEELQSLNEEMEAAKEELQSGNEELTTLNDELQARNAELSRLNSDLQNLLDSVHVPVLIVDAERRVRRFTAEALAALSFLPTDVGRSLGEIRLQLPGHDLDLLTASAIAAQTTATLEIRDRNDRWQRLEIRPYRTGAGKAEGAVVSLFDIDELKRAVDAAVWARDFATSIVEAVQFPLVVLDARLRTISANEVFRQSYGTAPHETHGVSFFEMGGGAWDIPALRSALEEMLAKDTRLRGLEVERELAGAGRKTLSFSARPIHALTGQPMILVAIEDVTERSRVETERARLLAEAQRMKGEAEQANRSKDQFLATLSHELRTPLTAILLHAQRLRRDEMDPARRAHAVSLIERSTKTQAQLIEDLLDVSRISAGKMKLEPRRVDLASVVRAAVELVFAQGERRSPEVEVALGGSSVWVEGDPTRLQQVVWNLLANALKFTTAPGRITVRLDTADGEARLRVIDSGAGIAPEFMPHVFGTFTQADSSPTRTRGGLGLGLAIVRHVVELHGGTVHAESAGVGKGATFTVLLPLAVAPAAAASTPRGPAAPPLLSIAPAPAPARVHGLRIVLVDDDPGTREAVAEILGHEGAEIRTATSAREGVEAVEAFKPEVVLSDIAMPGEDGYSFIARVRALGRAAGGEVPAIALSALASDDDRQRALAAGFQMHLGKPVDIDRLIGAVVEVWQRQPAPDEE
jgi:two-component system CheB/CheR fusion protein